MSSSLSPFLISHNMATNLTPVLSALFFTSIFFINLLPMIMSDDACPYPCFPPPSGLGTPTITTPPPPQSQSGLYPPPGYYPSPTGNLPNYNPPTSSGNNFNTPPPPDPILPYFPFYYRKPPHQTEVSSATSTLPRSIAMITTAIVLAFSFLFGFLLM